MKTQCERCGKGFRTLTKENLCAFCHHESYGEWAKEFTEEIKKSK